MRNERILVVALVASVLGAVVACSPSAKDSEQEVSASLLDNFVPRSPDDNILGNVGSDGLCVPSVIDIDHERNTAQIAYSGQPGDNISLEIVKNDGSVEKESFELGGTNTKWLIPTDIFNGDIETIKVDATGRVGKSGSCSIPVE